MIMNHDKYLLNPETIRWDVRERRSFDFYRYEGHRIWVFDTLYETDLEHDEQWRGKPLIEYIKYEMDFSPKTYFAGWSEMTLDKGERMHTLITATPKTFRNYRFFTPGNIAIEDLFRLFWEQNKNKRFENTGTIVRQLKTLAYFTQL